MDHGVPLPRAPLYGQCPSDGINNTCTLLASADSVRLNHVQAWPHSVPPWAPGQHLFPAAGVPALQPLHYSIMQGPITVLSSHLHTPKEAFSLHKLLCEAIVQGDLPQMDATLKAIARQSLTSAPGATCRGVAGCTSVAHALCQACASFSPAELEQLFSAYYERAQQQGTAGAICLLGLLVCFGGRPELADVSGRQLLEIAQPHCPQAGVLLGLCCQLGLQGAPLEVRRGAWVMINSLNARLCGLHSRQVLLLPLPSKQQWPPDSTL